MNKSMHASSAVQPKIGLSSHQPAPDLNWQALRMKSTATLQLHFLRGCIYDEYERALEELADRLKALFDLKAVAAQVKRAMKENQ